MYNSKNEFVGKYYRKVREALLRMSVSLYSNFVVRILVQLLTKPREPEKWVFILGCYNSGTTILKDLLSAHQDIRVLPKEGVRLTGMLPRPEDKGWTRMWIGCSEYMDMDISDISSSSYSKLMKDWSPWWKSGGTVFVEKSISNLTRIEWLVKAFPDAYFIGITRNGYAATEGIWRRAQPKGLARKKYGKQYPLELAAKQWVDANSRLLGSIKNIVKYHQISYENLIDNPETTLNGIFEFLDVSCGATVSNVSGGVKINSTKIELFDGNVRSIRRLTEEQKAVILDEIGSMQCQLGY